MESVTGETDQSFGKNLTVFFQFSSGNSVDHREVLFESKVIIQLYTDVCPIACENFLKLCTGEEGVLAGTNTKLHYLGCPIHRLVSGGWLQCGDIVDGTGANSIAAIGENHKVQDENLSVDFSEPLGGIVGFSTSSTHSNGSQFFITLGACPWMNNKFVGIGKVIEGFETLKQIGKSKTKNEKPIETIFVKTCGRYDS